VYFSFLFALSSIRTIRKEGSKEGSVNKLVLKFRRKEIVFMSLRIVQIMATEEWSSFRGLKKNLCRVGYYLRNTDKKATSSKIVLYTNTLHISSIYKKSTITVKNNSETSVANN